MESVLQIISGRVAEALAAGGTPGNPLVAASAEERFGDYQSNAAMGLAKSLGRKPRDVAQQIVARLRIDDLCEPPEIAGPGFINFRLKPAFLSRMLAAVPASSPAPAPPAPSGFPDRVGLAHTEKPEIVIVDLSSPNLAKEMHVGHLRSTVIGDCVARVLEFAGHEVIRENHVGDWGTQFGMLVAYLRRIKPDVIAHPDEVVIHDLESFYVQAKSLFDADEAFRDESRETVVALQKGDPAIRRIWRAFCDESLRHCHEIYDRLGVRLIDRGESFYNDLMDEAVRRVERLRDSGDPAVRDSAGALCIFPSGFTTREGQPLPVIVRKSDGGYNYTTSDLATLIHRIETLRATRIIYVVGLSQKQHFEMLFAAAPKVVIMGPEVRLEHLGFGNMLAPGGRPFKTREGGTIKLKGLLDEAVSRAREVIENRVIAEDEVAPGAGLEDPQAVAEAVGLGAIKYFDLTHSLSGDYTFDMDTMLSLEGNTAPYMMYAYARIRSIGRKAGVDFAALPEDAPILLEHPAEIALGKKLAQFAEKFAVLEKELRPNVLTDYLFELARAFSRFYDRKLGVRVIDASPEGVRLSRLRLCDLTARVLRLGLFLLGIQTIEQM